MKNTLAIIVALIYCTAFAQVPLQTANQTVSKDPKAQIKFETMVLDFGKIKKDTPAIRDFVFTNTGNAPLIIASARASCGCTTPTTPKEPIQPGHTGVISAGFNARNLGQFTKTITVTSNAQDSNVIITIKGEVVQ